MFAERPEDLAPKRLRFGGFRTVLKALPIPPSNHFFVSRGIFGGAQTLRRSKPDSSVWSKKLAKSPKAGVTAFAGVSESSKLQESRDGRRLQNKHGEMPYTGQAEGK